MSESIYEPFVSATRGVFELMLDLTDVKDQPIDSISYTDELAISIGVIGDLEGEIIYRFPHTTSLAMVKIMSSMEFDAVDEFVTSAISEIANIISGNVLSILAQKDLKCDILPPKRGLPESDQAYKLKTASCLMTDIGDVCLDIRLNPAS